MMKRDRSINIFNLSMLDVISGALGAFLIVMVILMPFYNKTSIDLQSELMQQREAAAAAERRAEAAQRETESAQRREAAAQERAAAAADRLAKVRFLIFSIRWPTDRHDVDLHIVDPSGAEFSYAQTTIPGRPGELTLDDTSGPGTEIWEIHDTPPGEYRFYLNLYARHGNSQNATVEMRLSYRDGVREFPRVTLAREQQKVLVATITVQEDGEVVVRAA